MMEDDDEEVTLEEFAWDLKRLLKEVYPEGIALVDISGFYKHWLKTVVEPCLFVRNSDNWENVLRLPDLRKTFQIFITKDNVASVKLKAGYPTTIPDLQIMLGLTRWKHYNIVREFAFSNYVVTEFPSSKVGNNQNVTFTPNGGSNLRIGLGRGRGRGRPRNVGLPHNIRELNNSGTQETPRSSTNFSVPPLNIHHGNSTIVSGSGFSTASSTVTRPVLSETPANARPDNLGWQELNIGEASPFSIQETDPLAESPSGEQLGGGGEQVINTEEENAEVSSILENFVASSPDPSVEKESDEAISPLERSTVIVDPAIQIPVGELTLPTPASINTNTTTTEEQERQHSAAPIENQTNDNITHSTSHTLKKAQSEEESIETEPPSNQNDSSNAESGPGPSQRVLRPRTPKREASTGGNGESSTPKKPRVEGEGSGPQIQDFGKDMIPLNKFKELVGGVVHLEHVDRPLKKFNLDDMTDLNEWVAVPVASDLHGQRGFFKSGDGITTVYFNGKKGWRPLLQRDFHVRLPKMTFVYGEFVLNIEMKEFTFDIIDCACIFGRDVSDLAFDARRLAISIHLRDMQYDHAAQTRIRMKLRYPAMRMDEFLFAKFIDVPVDGESMKCLPDLDTPREHNPVHGIVFIQTVFQSSPTNFAFSMDGRYFWDFETDLAFCRENLLFQETSDSVSLFNFLDKIQRLERQQRQRSSSTDSQDNGNSSESAPARVARVRNISAALSTEVANFFSQRNSQSQDNQEDDD